MMMADSEATRHSKLQRSAMFIAIDPSLRFFKPRRGGISPHRRSHAAPPGLRTILLIDICYKHIAPLELRTGATAQRRGSVGAGR